MLILFNKPFDVLSQFTDLKSPTTRTTLSSYIDIPKYYPAGRLDKDSEGLLLLTNNGQLQHQIAHPQHKKEKGYWLQLDGDITDLAIQQLAQGVPLKDGLTLPARVRKIIDPNLWPRVPPIRVRKNIPTSWLEIFIKEGKNRQLRRMSAHVGFPTLRLIRFSSGQWQLNDLKPGEYRLIDHVKKHEF